MKTTERARGQSLVELALALPVLILVLVGVFDLGRAFNAYIVISNAAREGAYYGTLEPFEHDAIVAQAINEAQGSGIVLTADDITVTSTGARGTPMRVTVHYDFALITSMITGGHTLPLEAHAEMMVVQK
jgi:Flp pilus assembly protein TadG